MKPQYTFDPDIDFYYGDSHGPVFTSGVDIVSAVYVVKSNMAAAARIAELEARIAELEATRLLPSPEVINVAQCVLAHTEITREHNGRGRSKTYASGVDDIANAARHLADLVVTMDGTPPLPEWTGKRVVAVVNRNGVTAYDGASFADTYHEMGLSGRLP